MQRRSLAAGQRLPGRTLCPGSLLRAPLLAAQATRPTIRAVSPLQAELLRGTAQDSCPHMRRAGSQQTMAAAKERPPAGRAQHAPLGSSRQRMMVRVQM